MLVNVRKGDTLWYYSQLFQVPFRLIVESNLQEGPGDLIPDQEIRIPGYVVSSYTVKNGDSFWSISDDRGIPLDALQLLNQRTRPGRLKAGQVIRVPVRVGRLVVQGKKNYDYATLMADLNQLAEIYPFMRIRSIGSSVMKKPIPEIRIGRGAKRVHVNASFHANEWITTGVVMTFLNDYLLALTNGGKMRGLLMAPFYETAELSMVPMVNPDGVDLAIHGAPEEEPYRSRVLSINQGDPDFSGWKANIRGVDLNDQFPAEWELEAERGRQQPSPRDYSGTAPLTEPESIAMAELTRQSDFSRVLAFHTQGKVIYWGFFNREPAEAERIVNEFSRVSGYEPVRFVESYAGYKDWFIQDWRRPGFTVELGQGVNPLPVSQFDEIYQESLGILLASLYM